MEESNKTVNISEELAEFIASNDYGTIIHYQDIEHVTRLRYKTQKYYNTIQKAKKLTEASGKAIKSIGGGDYQVIYPGDYAKEYVREVRIARNHVKHGEKLLNSAPVKDMSIEERGTYNNVCDFHARMQAQISGNYVEVKRLVSKRAHPFSTKCLT